MPRQYLFRASALEKRGAAVYRRVRARRKAVAVTVVQHQRRQERQAGARAARGAHDDADRRFPGAGMHRQDARAAEAALKAGEDVAQRLRPRDQRHFAAARLQDRRGRPQPAREKAALHDVRGTAQRIGRGAAGGLVEGRVHDDEIEAGVGKAGFAPRFAGRRHVGGDRLHPLAQNSQPVACAGARNAQLADLGIEVQINAPDRSAVGAIRVGGNWDIYMARFNVPRPDPVQIYDFHYGRNAGQNFSLIEGDEELFAAVDAGRTTLDREERRRHYLEVQNILIDKSYYAFLLFREARHVARTSLRNLAVDGGGVWNLAEVWLD